MIPCNQCVYAGEMDRNKDLSDFDKGHNVMARRTGPSISIIIPINLKIE